jgi:hypothetical protein
MVTLVTREAGSSPKGSPLTNAEIDNNFLNLDAGKQDKNANLTAFSGLTGVADRLFYWNGDGTLGQGVYTALARTINSRATAALMRSDLGVNFGASADDVTSGNTLRVGDFGLGTSNILVDHNDATMPTKFFISDTATTNRPGSGAVGFNIKRNATQAMQMIAEMGGELKFRVFNNTFGGWNTIFHSGNVPSFGQSLLGAATAALARTTLQLGSAALATLSTSSQDRTANAVLKYGDFGVGVPIYTEGSDINQMFLEGSFFCGTPTNSPIGGNGWLKVIGYPSDLWCIQIWTALDGRQCTRIRANGTFLPWEINVTSIGGAISVPGKLTLNGALDEAPVASMTAAATLDIGAVAASSIFVSGATTISSLGTARSGTRRTLRFNGALTLTYSGNLILPGSANVGTFIGDYATFVSYGAGVWECESYTRSDGSSLRVITVERGGTGSSTTTGARTTLGVGTSDTVAFASLELYNATPVIDFHYGNGQTDYDVRLVNESTGKLKLYGNYETTGNITSLGSVYANSGVFYSKAPSAGANAHFWLQGEAGQSRALMYAGADNVLRFQAAGVEQLTVSPAGYTLATQLRSAGNVYAGGTAAVFGTDGNLYGSIWGNNWLSNVVLTASNFRSHLANLRATELGGYVLAVSLVGGVGLNSGVSGSNLRYSATSGSNPGAGMAGNYYAAGYILNALEVTLWQRYV